MYKTKKRLLAIAVAAVLLLGLFPMSVFAAAGDTVLATATFNGVTLEEITAVAAATTIATINAAVTDGSAGVFQLALQPSELVGAGLSTNPFEGPEAAAVARLITKSAWDGLTGTDALSTLDSAGATILGVPSVTVAHGDRILLKSTTGAKYAVIVIKDITKGDLGGTTTVESPTYNVVVPLDVDFAIDPLSISPQAQTTLSQIAGADYQFINKSDVPVKVSVNFTATLANGATLTPLGNLDQTSLSPTTKGIYLGLLAAKEAGTANIAEADLGSVTYNYDATEAGTLVEFTNDGGIKAGLDFVLAAGTSTEITQYQKNYGFTSFTFYGQLNTYATWAPGDVSIGGTYSLQGVRSTDYFTAGDDTGGASDEDDLDTANGIAEGGAPATAATGFVFDTVGLNVLPKAVTADITITGATTASAAISYATQKIFTIQLPAAAGTTVDHMYWAADASNDLKTTATVTYNAATKVITVDTSGWGSFSAAYTARLFIDTSGDNYTITAFTINP
ncbi:MAG: hypothetical protein LBS10_08470 [Gracilibacteraceae bacterium]|jgi:hypothetical protein|nr:hypothetical protein [Gracilibacteraceae bacterium]